MRCSKLYLILLSGLVSCTNFFNRSIEDKAIRINGSYESESESEFLKFSKDNFTFSKRPENIIIHEVIWIPSTYGQFYQKDSFIYLNSAAELDSTIEMNVVETNDGNQPNNLNFKIHNSIEKSYDLLGGEDILLNYEVVLMNEKDTVQYLFDDNYFNAPNQNFKSFYINIYPTKELLKMQKSLEKVNTQQCFINNEDSNHFNILMEELTLQYLGLLRLSNEPIKIIDKKTLEWKGELYIRN